MGLDPGFHALAAATARPGPSAPARAAASPPTRRSTRSPAPAEPDTVGHAHPGRLMATVVVGRRGATSRARPPTGRSFARFLERDRLYAAYAICDLEEREFARTRWGAA